MVKPITAKYWAFQTLNKEMSFADILRFVYNEGSHADREVESSWTTRLD